MMVKNRFFILTVGIVLSACGSTIDDLVNENDNNGGGGTDGCPLQVEDDITTATTWSCSTINVTESIRVLAALAIDPGVTVVFASGADLEVEPEGSLNAVGTASERIVFRGSNAVKSFWGGIAITSNSAENQLRFVDIRDTGASGLNFDTNALRVTGPSIDQGRLIFTDSTVSNGGATGLFVDNGGILDEFARNTFEGMDGYPVDLQFSNVDAIDSTSSYAGGTGDSTNTRAAVFVRAGDFTGTGVMDALDVPYVLNDGVHQVGNDSAAGNLTIAAGAELQFDGGRMEVDSGTLQAVGSPGMEILFTSFSGATEGWGGLAFVTNGDNRIENAIIEFAGGSGFQFNTNTIFVAGGGLPSATLTLSNSLLRNNGDESSGPGAPDPAAVIRVLSGGTLNQSGNAFTNNEGPDIVFD